MKLLRKSIKTVKDHGTNSVPFDMEEFASCLRELVQTDEILPVLRDLFTTIKLAKDEDCGIKHVSLEELRSTIDTMNGVFDDGIGVEKSFITEMARPSNDISAMIISPFVNSELWIVQLHDNPGYLGELRIDAINCTCMHENMQDDSKYMVGVIILSPVEDDVAKANQILRHEVTHYLMSYIEKFVDHDTITKINRIQDCAEFMADFLQFITFKPSFKDGLKDFMDYEDMYFDESVKGKYFIPLGVVTQMVTDPQSKYGKL